MQALLRGLPTVAVIAAVDHYLDLHLHYDFTFTAFYALPIAFAVWSGCLGAAGILAAAAIACHYGSVLIVLGDVVYRHPLPVLLLDMLLRISSFAIVIILSRYLRKAVDGEMKLSRTDPLTGVGNTRAFEEHTERALERMRRRPNPMTVIYLDVDDFKKVNDSMGHKGGDRVLKIIGGALLTATRSIDIIARVGGDEFVVVMPDTGSAEGHVATERLQHAISARLHNAVTVSIGTATFHQPPRSIDDLLEPADKAMYKAKANGKNHEEHVDVVAAIPVAH